MLAPTPKKVKLESVPADRRHMMYTRVLLAYTSGEGINIGYDGTGTCAEGYIRVERVG